MLGYIKDSFSIVLEYMEQGDLCTYIRRHPTMKWPERFHVMFDVAKGLLAFNNRNVLFTFQKDIRWRIQERDLPSRC